MAVSCDLFFLYYRAYRKASACDACADTRIVLAGRQPRMGHEGPLAGRDERPACFAQGTRTPYPQGLSSQNWILVNAFSNGLYRNRTCNFFYKRRSLFLSILLSISNQACDIMPPLCFTATGTTVHLLLSSMASSPPGCLESRLLPGANDLFGRYPLCRRQPLRFFYLSI